MDQDIRFKQRFENYEKSFLLLKNAVSLASPSVIEKAGSIQFFETTFELAWKLLKDYLTYSGYSVKSPRESIKRAFSADIIQNGDLWIEALMDRNLTTHTYDEKIAEEIFLKIKSSYFPLLEALYIKFKDDLCMD
jgi:nucleotidyltransferase substrate binding protein (TIGR01987 family)